MRWAARFYNICRLEYYQWALREIPPAHKDVPLIVAHIEALILYLENTHA